MRARGTSPGATGRRSAGAGRLHAGDTAEARFASVLTGRAAAGEAEESLLVPPELRLLLQACRPASEASEVLFEEVDSPTPQPWALTPTGGGTPGSGGGGVLEALPDLPELAESQHDAQMLWEFEELTKRLPLPGRGHPLKNARASEKQDASRQFGPYRLIEKIAVGGMAEVFKAKRAGIEGFEKVVALKRILPHLSTNQEFLTMFVDEAKVVARLAHPNIVPIFDLGRIDDSYYIAMELVQGRDLRSVIRRARQRRVELGVELAVLITSRVCSALEYAHRKRDEKGRAMQIVHRDISPQNILLSFEGEVKLTDFGIAKAAHKASVTQRGTLRGKVTYMSPEQASGTAMDGRSDLFSLGIVLYELVTGRRPFGSTDASDKRLLELVRECRVTPPTVFNPSLPGLVERITLRALQRDPESRYADAGSMQADLEDALHTHCPATSKDLTHLLGELYDEAERIDAVDDGTPGAAIDAPEPRVRKRPPRAFEPLPPLSRSDLLKRFGDG